MTDVHQMLNTSIQNCDSELSKTLVYLLTHKLQPTKIQIYCSYSEIQPAKLAYHGVITN